MVTHPPPDTVCCLNSTCFSFCKAACVGGQSLLLNKAMILQWIPGLGNREPLECGSLVVEEGLGGG